MRIGLPFALPLVIRCQHIGFAALSRSSETKRRKKGCFEEKYLLADKLLYQARNSLQNLSQALSLP